MIFTDYPGHLVALLLVLASAAILFIAFRASQLQTPQRSRYRWLLAAMHYTAVLLLLVVLWNPSAWQKKDVFGRNTVLAIFDTSESMSIADEGRAARLDKALERFAECLDVRGSAGPEFRVYGFDGRGYHCGSADLLRRWGSESNLHEAFALIVDSATQDGPAGAVVFTDGRADDRDPRRYLPLQRDDLPILFVGVGSRGPRPDVAITAMSSPATAWVDAAYTVGVAVTAANVPSVPVSLELVCDDKVIETRQLGREQFKPSDSGQAEAVIDFTVPAQQLGTHVLAVRAKPCKGEINLANNERSTSVEVTRERSLRVLLYTQWASFDIGKIRQALAWDKRIRLDLGFDVIRESGLADRASQGSGYVTLPESKDGFHEYDVIILGPCDAGTLADAQRDGLYSFVAERGGGLLLLPGRTVASLAASRDERARAILPILWRAGRAAALGSGAALAARGHLGLALPGYNMPMAPQVQGQDALATLGIPEPGRLWPPHRDAIRLTFEAEVSRLFDPSILADAQASISPYYEFIDVKPAATTLATAVDVPIIAVQRLGRGRVCLLNASKLFTLYREDRQGGALSELVCSIVAYLGRTPAQGAGVELFAERAGEDPRRVVFSAYVVDKAFQGLPNANRGVGDPEPAEGANVLLTAGERVVSMEPTGRGYYRATLDWGPAQSVVATAQAERSGSFLGERTIATNLPPVRDEMSCVDLDEPFLRALAERVRARYVHVDELDGTAAKLFVPRHQVGVTETVNSVWPRWPLLVILCLLLSAGWFIRRAIGLV